MNKCQDVSYFRCHRMLIMLTASIASRQQVLNMRFEFIHAYKYLPLNHAVHMAGAVTRCCQGKTGKDLTKR